MLSSNKATKSTLPIFLSRSALPLTRAQNNHTNDNTSFVFTNNDYDIMCDSFKSANFSEDLAVTTKRYNQIKTYTAVDETLRVLKSVEWMAGK